MPKIVILDAYTTNPGDLSWDWLNQYGETEIFDRTPCDKITERVKDADVVITNKTPLTAETIDKMEKCRFIALLSTGYNIVDWEYAAKKGIPVSNIPTYSTMAVAQLVFAFISELCNGVGLHSADVRNGGWSSCPDFCYWKQPLTELCGKTIGIIGFGKIGQAVADIAEAYKMNILAVSGHETDQSDRKNFKWASLDGLLRNSDIITLHCPLTEQTTGMVNAEFLSKCKPSAFVINTSRGPVVDEKALADALNSGRIAGAAVDVLSTEPPRSDNPLLSAKNCYITPHIAWAGYETRQRLMGVLQENFKAFFDGKPINTVNM
ncbi:MAG TPA: glycerate dehydrogenase [Ruminococcaceae bacterium]|nr:glycerate dehydrogenase [Oscillospiraceae bacterium]